MTLGSRDPEPDETSQPTIDIATTRTSSQEQASLILTRKQRVTGIALLVVMVVAFVIAPEHTTKTAILLISILYLGSSCYRLLVSILGARVSLDRPIKFFPDRDLPIYTVLVPVYREAALIPGLIASISRLDYPADKLDVLLLLERDDEATLSTVDALDTPDFVRSLIVPDFGPKGKPRACNAGLAQARGTLLVIYDAEDAPEPDQLKKVVATFQSSKSDLACVQCKLDFFNANENLLTRWFTSEYSAWFDLYLPGLDRTHLPIPLGGTSNHFVTSSLRDLGGWDPYNVTEDADLGMRLARSGLTTRMIDSTTWEEANPRLGNWIRQRSRWMKGYAVTWLVHMRDPWRLYREVGLGGFLSVQITLGITIGMALINPVFWLMTLAWVLTRADLIHTFFSGPTFFIGSISFFAGNWILILTTMIGCYRRHHFKVVKYTLLLPVYWGLMSIAAWKGVLQLWRRPSFWEKTEHGLTTQVAPSGIAAEGPLMSPAASSSPFLASTYLPGVRTEQMPQMSCDRMPRKGHVEPESSLLTRTDGIIWLIFGAIAVTVGLWASLHQHAYQGDGLSRTYAALQVVRGYEPKLANIGLIWPVLPTLAQVPLAVVAPELASNGGTGPIVSGIAFGASVMLLNRILRYYLTGRVVRWIVLVFTFTNPLVLQSTVSGLSEMIFIAFVLLGWWGVEIATRSDDRVLSGILMASLGASGAFGCRYEGVVIGAAFMVVLFGLRIDRARKYGNLRQSISSLEAGMVIFLMSFGYAIFLFFFFNYTIMGNALYFANGPGSINQWMSYWIPSGLTVSRLVGDPTGSARYALTATWFVCAGLLLILPLAVALSIKLRDLRLLFLLGITLITPAQQAFVTYQGQSAGWKRYYVAAVFFGIILIVYVLKLLIERTSGLAARTVLICCVMLVGLSNAIAWRANEDQRVASDFSSGYLKRAFALSSDDAYSETGADDGRRIGLALANTVLTENPDALILADDLDANMIILFSNKPANFVVRNNHQFDRFVEDPVGNVQYFLVPDSTILANLILDHYPDLLTRGEPFLTLVATFQEEGGARHRWLLYRVGAEPGAHQSTLPTPRGSK